MAVVPENCFRLGKDLLTLPIAHKVMGKVSKSLPNRKQFSGAFNFERAFDAIESVARFMKGYDENCFEKRREAMDSAIVRGTPGCWKP